MCDEVPHAEGAVAQLARVGLGPGDQFLHVVHRDRGRTHQQHQRALGTHRDRAERGDWVVGGGLQGVRRLRHGGRCAVEDGVAIGCGAHHLLRGDHRAAAGLVVDDHRHAELFRQLGQRDARHRIRAGTGREGHDRCGSACPWWGTPAPAARVPASSAAPASSVARRNYSNGNGTSSSSLLGLWWSGSGGGPRPPAASRSRAASWWVLSTGVPSSRKWRTRLAQRVEHHLGLQPRHHLAPRSRGCPRRRPRGRWAGGRCRSRRGVPSAAGRGWRQPRTAPPSGRHRA